MDKDYIISQLAISKAQLEVNYLELQHKAKVLEEKIRELEGKEKVKERGK